MKKSCKYCGRVHPIGYDCPMKPKPKIDYHSPKIRKFRSSGAWAKVRAEVLERDGYRCRVCEVQQEPRRYNQKKLSVHHITPLADDMSMAEDPENLITLCDRHHAMADNGEISKKILLKLIPPG